MKCRRVSAAYSPHTVPDTNKGVEPVSKTVDGRLLPGSCGELECALACEQCHLLRMREKVKSTWCLTAVLLFLKSPNVFVHLMGNMGSIMFCMPHLEDFYYCVHSDWPFGQCTKNPRFLP